jgi:large subunit ribosomal protein L6
MSRVAKSPITVPSGVEIKIANDEINVKGSKGNMQLTIHNSVKVNQEDGVLNIEPVKESKDSWAMAGTFRALINNMVVGVSTGFSKKLQLVGVGYRAQAKGKVLNLNLGFSHPIDYAVPEGVTVETPSQTEIVVSGCDKQKVGQAAAVIRSYRPPEPYKGKGVRYADEHVVRKEAKKK